MHLYGGDSSALKAALKSETVFNKIVGSGNAI